MSVGADWHSWWAWSQRPTGPANRRSSWIRFASRSYEDATSKLVPDDLKVAVVLRHVPGEVGTQMRMQANSDMTYTQLILKLEEHYVATRPWLGRVALDPKHGDSHRAHTNAPSITPTAMDVDQVAFAVVAAPHGKGKFGKGKFGKGGKGGKGKDGGKGKGKGKDGGRGAGAGKGGTGPQAGCFN